MQRQAEHIAVIAKAVVGPYGVILYLRRRKRWDGDCDCLQALSCAVSINLIDHVGERPRSRNLAGVGARGPSALTQPIAPFGDIGFPVPTLPVCRSRGSQLHDSDSSEIVPAPKRASADGTRRRIELPLTAFVAGYLLQQILIDFDLHGPARWVGCRDSKIVAADRQYLAIHRSGDGDRQIPSHNVRKLDRKLSACLLP